MFNRYHNSLTLGKMGVSEEYHLPTNGAPREFTDESLSGIMSLKSHYNLASGRDTQINRPPYVAGSWQNYVDSYYTDSTDRAIWDGWPSTNYVPLFNDRLGINVTLQRNDLLILIMFSARGALHVSQTSNVFTKNRVGTWSTFGSFSTVSSTGASAFYIRIPSNATDDQLVNEYPYIIRGDVTAGTNMGTSTSASNITDGTVFVIRGVPTNRTPFINATVTGTWIDADSNEIAQRSTLQVFGTYNTLYLNFVYTPISVSAGDAYPDAVGGVYSNDLAGGFANGFYGNYYSANGLWETWDAAWVNDNNPRMYSTSPIYNNRLQRHNFRNFTFPAITGFYDSVGGILIEIPY
jgi:hypothetical protein